MNFLALDLSVRSTGFALWSQGQALPVSGTWALGSLEWRGRAFVRLHKQLLDLHRVASLDEIVFEEPLSPGSLHGHTNVATLYLAAGLAAHVESFAEAVGARHRAVHQATWRRHFIGKMPRGTKTPDLKHMAMTRCRDLGFDVQKHDAAEACGLLDYQLIVAGIIAPWRAGVLEREMMPSIDGRAAV
ncbi:hypothetical protein [Sphingomonas sp. URHD0057]|uniref:hypothetical protein n=1 Tax=Sphingomonas sp. URHD0057 TaxID=1380389 RepID=UPI000490929A|nr:hypothetical protein [Sphingomonas sp. URHD0057]